MKKLTALLLTLLLTLSLAACGPSQDAADVVRYGMSNAWEKWRQSARSLPCVR